MVVVMVTTLVARAAPLEAIVATCTLPLATFARNCCVPPRGTWAAFGETVTVTALLPPPPPQPHSARAATPAAATNVLRMCPTFIPVPPRDSSTLKLHLQHFIRRAGQTTARVRSKCPAHRKPEDPKRIVE